MSAAAKSIILRPWPRLLNIETAADYSGVSRGMVRQWVLEGKLTPHPLPGIRGRQNCEKIVIERGHFDRFLNLRPE